MGPSARCSARRLAAFAPMAALLGLGACADAGPPPPASPAYAPAFTAPPPMAPPLPALAPSPPGLLPEPPADAQPGACFAKVVVPGEPIMGPPPPPQAVWVLTPPAPGQDGPMWCLYFQPGRPMPVGWTPEQHGWIRVICDKDATVGLIAGLQGRLKAWGVYAGPVSGRYDAATARAVVRFQTERRIPHGGYLSLATVQALRDEPGPPSPPAPAASIYPSSAHGATFPGQWSPPEPPQAPCGQAPCSPAPCPGSSPCAVILAPRAAFAPYRPLLSWPGKSIY